MNIYSIYKITNQINDKMYVGFTSKSIEHRFRMHKAKARKSSYYLYNAMRKHGIENFTIEAIYQSNHLDHTLHVMEKYFIEQYGTHYSTDGGYNMTYGGEGTMGLSPWNKGIKMSDGHCNKLSDSHMGIAHTVETRTKMSETRTGMIKSFEHRNNLSLSLRGKNVPTHRRKLISETLKNKPKLTCDICAREFADVGANFMRHRDVCINNYKNGDT